MLDDPLMKTNPLRTRQRDKIMPVVTAKFSAETAASLCAKLEKLKIPFGPLAKPGDLFEDRHLNEGGRMLDVVLPNGKHAKIPGIPLDMGGRKPAIRRQPPTMGADTRAVLAEAGYAKAEIDELVKQKVVIAAE
jgi:crotonobetainyl-CoA:carnitine CoA-transferase CaiB-like acyl-CoA transferase